MRPLLLIICITLAACHSPKPQSITIDALTKLQQSAPLKPRMLNVSCALIDKNDVMHTPSITAKPGQKCSIEVVREFLYPIAYDLPEAARIPKAKDGNLEQFPITPSTPTEFDMRETGLSLELIAKPRGALVEVAGTLKQSTHKGYGRGAGEAFSPITDAAGKITLTNNRVSLPIFDTSERRVHCVGLPGKPMRIEYEDGLVVEMRVDVVK